MELVNHLAEQYAAFFSSPEDELVHRVADYTAQTHTNAHMLSGHLQGCFLTFLSRLLVRKMGQDSLGGPRKSAGDRVVTS